MSLHLLIIFFLFILFPGGEVEPASKRKWPSGNTGFGSPFFYYSNHVSTLLYFDNNRRPVSFVPLLSKNGTKIFFQLFFKDFWVYLFLYGFQSRFFYQKRYPARKLLPVQDNEILFRLMNPDWSLGQLNWYYFCQRNEKIRFSCEKGMSIEIGLQLQKDFCLIVVFLSIRFKPLYPMQRTSADYKIVRPRITVSFNKKKRIQVDKYYLKQLKVHKVEFFKIQIFRK